MKNGRSLEEGQPIKKINDIVSQVLLRYYLVLNNSLSKNEDN